MSAPACPPVIRAAEAEDLDAVLEVERAAFGAAAWSAGMVEGALRSATAEVLIAQDAASGAPLGHAIGQIAGDVGEVLELGVAPGARRAGLGAALLAALEHALTRRGASEIWLELRADNAAALALYQGAGYAVTGARRRYYSDGADAILMGKTAHRSSHT